jgi:hypothetical protein
MQCIGEDQGSSSTALREEQRFLPEAFGYAAGVAIVTATKGPRLFRHVIALQTQKVVS